MVVGDQKLSVGVGAVVTLTIPDGARSVWIQADGGHVRYRLTGEDPTTSTGLRLLNNSPPERINVPDLDLADIRFISESGTVAVEAVFFG